ncbi:MAG: transporter, partial [Phenylobacterium sp.]|nr:transporter [Phenylobacterium sp.]
ALAFVTLALTLDAANVSGAQAMTANAYGADLRVTAFGWISGLGRLIGGSAGAMVGAHMVSAQWPVRSIGALFAATFFINAVLVRLLRRRLREPAPLMPLAQPAMRR